MNVEKIRLFPFDQTGGLKPLGKLARNITIAAVIPMLYVSTVLYENYSKEEVTLLDKPMSMFMLVIYAAVLVIIFLYPIKPVHTTLGKAKTKAKEKLGLMIAQKSGRGIPDNPENFGSLNSLLSTYERLKKAPTWPLDLRLYVTSAVPIISPVLTGTTLKFLLPILEFLPDFISL